jgi:hypothetical protein
MSVNEKMKAIADEVRELSGTSDALGLDAMAVQISAANAQVANQDELIQQIKTALQGKPVNSKNYELITIKQDCSNTLAACTAFEEFINDDDLIVIFVNENFISKPDINMVNNTALVFVWFSNIFENNKLGLWLRWRDNEYSIGNLINSLYDFIISSNSVFRKVVVK